MDAGFINTHDARQRRLGLGNRRRTPDPEIAGSGHPGGRFGGGARLAGISRIADFPSALPSRRRLASAASGSLGPHAGRSINTRVTAPDLARRSF